MSFLHQLEGIFDIVVRAGILLFNTIGVVILLWTAVRCVIMLHKKDPLARINLAEGTALALSFKLGAEVLRTVNVREWSELGMLGAIIALRVALAFLIQWEIKVQRKSLSEENIADSPPAAAETAESGGKSAA